MSAAVLLFLGLLMIWLVVTGKARQMMAVIIGQGTQ